MRKKVVVAIGGASGAIYAKILLDKLIHLQEQIQAVGVVTSPNALVNWRLELGEPNFGAYPFTFYENNDFMAPFASGSAKYDTIIICPCSAGLMGRIANGISNDLITRAADVALKERRKLIVVLRETPYSLIHIQNMKTITEAGGIICPATPSFYSQAKTVEALSSTVVDRVLDLAGFQQSIFRWSEETDS